MPETSSAVLPNGRRIAHLNRSETDYLYQEIFIDRTYTPGSFPTLPTQPTIFDIGANIGLFTLFALDRWPDARVYAFEPVPEIFQVLRENLRPYPNAHPIATALGAIAGTATTGYYPRYTMMSGLYTDPARDRAIAKQYLLNATSELPDADAIANAADELLASRFDVITVDCAVETVSDAAERLGLDRVDLMKVDVERGELDVLAGIDEQLWPAIGNVVVETEDAEQVENLLTAHGMRVALTQPPEYQATALRILHATR